MCIQMWTYIFRCEATSFNCSRQEDTSVIFVCWLWNTLTPRRRHSLLEKSTVAQLLKNLPTFYETRRFITVFTRVRHWSLSWTRWEIYTSRYNFGAFTQFCLIFLRNVRLGENVTEREICGSFSSATSARHIFRSGKYLASYYGDSHRSESRPSRKVSVSFFRF
jgi:hypothetical protein